MVFVKESKGALNKRDVRLADAGDLLWRETVNEFVKFGFVFLRLRDGALGFEQDDGLEIDAIFRRHFLFVLIQNQSLQDALSLVKIRLNNDDIL